MVSRRMDEQMQLGSLTSSVFNVTSLEEVERLPYAYFSD
jgi:hypothetical protein